MGVSISGDMRVDDHSKSVSLSTSLDAKTTQNPSHRGGSQVFAEVQQLLENPEVMKNLAVIAGELQNGKMTSLGLEQLLFWAEILKKLLKMSQKKTRKIFTNS